MIKFVVAAAFALTASSAYAEPPQQEKMKACNADAAKQELKGEERKEFMKQCLSVKKEEQAEKKEVTPQQQKMKDCNKDAKEKKLRGDERRKFMSGCLSK